MKYDFDTPIDRRGTNSLKWETGAQELPMWVADMDFLAAPEIREALQRRMDHGIFGYSVVPKEWQEAYIGWWKERHGLEIKEEWLHFCTGVMPAISSIVRRFTAPGEKVLIQTPVYHCFSSVIRNSGRQVLENPLLYENGEYRMDFADLEEKLSDLQAALFVLCNPQNPGGKIWEKEILERVGALCRKYDVLVLSDEIHCDLTDPGCAYVPFASVSDICRDNSLTCIAPTKAFNLAGLQTAAVMVPSPALRRRAWSGLVMDEAAEPNAFAVDAAIAAFTKGGPWLEELRKYVFENKKLVRDFLEKEVPQIRMVPSQATYLLWLDCQALPGKGAGLAGFLRKETGLFVSPGEQFGGNGPGFLRMNIACPRTILQEGLERLKRGVSAYMQGGGSLKIRRSTGEDLPRMMEIYQYARKFMTEHGNPNQWGATNWPPKSLIESDIADGNSYVCEDGDRIVGTFFFCQGEEPTYRVIEDGNWLEESPYGVIHRIAGDGTVKGIGSFCIRWAFQQCGHLRMDTHGDNKVMQNLLKKNGFVRCGIIHVEEDADPRLAYEKLA